MNHRPSHRSSDDEAIEAQAAAWLAQRDEGLTEAEEVAFARWRQDDVRHEAAVTRLERTWGRLQQLRGFRPAARVHPDPDLLAPPPRLRRWRPVLAGALAASVLAAMGLAWLRWLPERVFDAQPSLYATTAEGYQRTILPDGSILELNASSEVETAYTPTERRVRLVRGEAHFTVAKHQPQPFFVEAGSVTLKAVGTAFNVRLRSEDVEVLVTEGRVQVNHPRALLAPDEASAASLADAAPAPPAVLPLLTAGQRVTLPKAPLMTAALTVQTVAPEVIREELAWQGARLVFVETSLADVVQQFNRHNQVQLSLADSELGEILVGGSFRPEGVEAFVRLLASENGIVVERPSADRIVLRSKR